MVETDIHWRGGEHMSAVPDHLRRMVVEGTQAGAGDPHTQNELLLALVDAVEAHNAILYDAIAGELKAISAALTELTSATRANR
jgi:hypothetical protein